MKAISKIVGVVSLAAASVIAMPRVQAADKANAIAVGAFGGGTAGSSAVAGTVEYERLVTDWLSLGVRASGVSYDYEEDSYEESGDGNGLDAAVNFYFTGNGIEGPNVSIYAGLWEIDWEWTDPTDSPRAGAGTSSSAVVSASFGWKFRIGDSFVLEPSVMVGDFLANSEDDAGTNEQELGFFAAVGLSLGFAF